MLSVESQNFLLTARIVHQIGFDDGLVGHSCNPNLHMLEHYEGTERDDLVVCYMAGHAKGVIRKYQKSHNQNLGGK